MAEKRRKPPKWTVVRVRWRDAVTVRDASNSNDPTLCNTAVRYTVGHLLKFDPRNVISVAMEDDREGEGILAEDEGDVDCQTITNIPAGMILRAVAYPEDAAPFVFYEASVKRKATSSMPAAAQSSSTRASAR